VLDFGLDRIYLTVDDLFIDDDAHGASHGDGDGIVEFDETIELRLQLHNIGHLDAFAVTADLSSSSPFVGLVQGAAAFGNIPGGEVGSNAVPYVFHVTHDVPDGEVLHFDLSLSEDPGQTGFDVIARAPAYLIGVTEIDDTGGGNGNGMAEPGETVEITLRIENVGGCATPVLTAELGSGSPYFTADPTPHALGAFGVGESIVEDGFTVTIDPGCPPVYTHQLRLVLAGPSSYIAALPFLFCVGEIFADDMEASGASWTHTPGPGAWADQWHLETYRNHTYAGQTSWKCGGAGSLTYGNLVYALLETAEFDLPAGARLEFWHWIDAETSAAYPDHCYDGGLIEISVDDGITWQQLTPGGGYPYLIRTGITPGPFPAETPVWSGTHDWAESWVDLTGYAGLARLRWAFGSDGADMREGWYIDDVRIVVPPMSGAPGGEEAVIRPVLHPVTPSLLAGGGVTVRFATPRAAEGELAVFDAGGRLVRTLVRGMLAAGEHHVRWDGRDAAGRPVVGGSYYCRLAADGVMRSQRVTVVR
jgi:hypothetical protein